jgi:hypothetical protein
LSIRKADLHIRATKKCSDLTEDAWDLRIRTGAEESLPASVLRRWPRTDEMPSGHKVTKVTGN